MALPDAVVFGSIAHELGGALYASFRGAVRVVAAQGYLREWDADGIVRPRVWADAEAVLGEVDAVVVSEEDLAGDERVAAAWSRGPLAAEGGPALIGPLAAEGGPVLIGPLAAEGGAVLNDALAAAKEAPRARNDAAEASRR